MANVLSNIVELCIFRRLVPGPEYLLLRRSLGEAMYPGIWQFVTGSVEGQEKATDAARRELSEETGLVPDAMWIVPVVLSFYDQGRDAVHLSPLFAAEVSAAADPQLSTEHTEFGWYAFEPALKKLVWPGQREGLRIVHDYIVSGQEASLLTRIL